MTTATETDLVTFTRLRSGNWGIRGNGLTPGDRVAITLADGSMTTETVGNIVWSDPDSDLRIAAIAVDRHKQEREDFRRLVEEIVADKFAELAAKQTAKRTRKAKATDTRSNPAPF